MSSERLTPTWQLPCRQSIYLIVYYIFYPVSKLSFYLWVLTFGGASRRCCSSVLGKKELVGENPNTYSQNNEPCFAWPRCMGYVINHFSKHLNNRLKRKYALALSSDPATRRMTWHWPYEQESASNNWSGHVLLYSSARMHVPIVQWPKTSLSIPMFDPSNFTKKSLDSSYDCRMNSKEKRFLTCQEVVVKGPLVNGGILQRKLVSRSIDRWRKQSFYSYKMQTVHQCMVQPF